MSNAIIGHTGFVGGNLKAQQSFTDEYNTKNIKKIRGRHFQDLIISGVSAVKWLANKEPENDLSSINDLMNNLSNVKSESVTLISTIDVYKTPINVFENSELKRDGLHPYGLHRLMFEEFIKNSFENVTIIRLPGLFGEGLRKNVIYDFLTNNNVNAIDTKHSFQFYDLANLSEDIQKTKDNNIPLLNLSVEPVLVSEVAEICLKKTYFNDTGTTPISYNFKSNYSHLWHGDQGYLYTKQQCLTALKKFVNRFQNV